MSMKLMVQAMSVKTGSPLQKLILLKLADNANDQGECWPSHQHIADQCEIGKSTVRKHIKSLYDKGFLRIEHRVGPKGNSSNLYHLMLHPMPQDSIGMPPYSTPPVLPRSTRTSHSIEPVNEPINFDEFINSYHELLPSCTKVGAVTQKRKTTLKNFLLKNRMDLDKFRNYLTAIDQYCKWMTEPYLTRTGNTKKNGFDYFVSDRCYQLVKDEAADSAR